MAWYNGSWNYRQKVTVDHTKVGGATQSNFPVLVDLANMQTGFFTHVKSDGTDIVVTSDDGTTKLNRELVAISTGSSTGELYFNAPSLSYTADTDFYIYYGNANGAETNDTTTWGANYSHIYHLEALTDSKGTNNLTNVGSCVNEAVKIGKGYRIPAVSAHIDMDSDIVMAGNWSMQWWMKQTGANQVYVAFNKKAVNTAYVLPYSGNYIETYRDGDQGATDFTDWTDYTTLDHYVLTNDPSGNLLLYRNATVGTAKANYGTNNFSIGQMGRSVDALYSFVGQFDEVRFSDVTLTSNWITCEYNNQNSPSTFYAVGTEETGTSTSTTSSSSSSTSSTSSSSSSSTSSTSSSSSTSSTSSSSSTTSTSTTLPPTTTSTSSTSSSSTSSTSSSSSTTSTSSSSSTSSTSSSSSSSTSSTSSSSSTTSTSTTSTSTTSTSSSTTSTSTTSTSTSTTTVAPSATEISLLIGPIIVSLG